MTYGSRGLVGDPWTQVEPGSRAWVVGRPGPVDSLPLRLVDREPVEPIGHQVRVRVSCCGVCRTDLHLAEGDLPPRQPDVVPGHEVVGIVTGRGRDVTLFAIGDRVGVAWLASTDGACRFCRQGRENLCEGALFTGWDVDGGFADTCLVDERYAYAMPDTITDEQAAPLLCAGIIGYRALRTAAVPPGGSLGLYGFGGSAHLTAQLALHLGLRVHVVSRGARLRQLAHQLGVDSVSPMNTPPPEKLDGAILFAPAGELVPAAMEALDAGGTLAVAGIHLSQISPLNYARQLFREKVLRSVTANTRQDGTEFLRLATRFDLRSTVAAYSLADAPKALSDLAHGRFAGAAVIHMT